MKEAKEYLKNVTCLTLKRGLYEIGKQMQKDAYNQAIDDAAEFAGYKEIDDNPVNPSMGSSWISCKKDILKLKK